MNPAVEFSLTLPCGGLNTEGKNSILFYFFNFSPHWTVSLFLSSSLFLYRHVTVLVRGLSQRQIRTVTGLNYLLFFFFRVPEYSPVVNLSSRYILYYYIHSRCIESVTNNIYIYIISGGLSDNAISDYIQSYAMISDFFQ